jgi:hypothetical protein
MDELDLDEFIHGGVNITGFRLLDPDNPRFAAAQLEWRKLNPSFWFGAGVGSKLGVRKIKFLFKTFASIQKLQF